MVWRGTIIEQVPEMRSATRAFYLITRHPMTGIGGFRYFVGGQWRIKTRPPGSRFKLRIGTEQLISACGTEIDPLLMIVPIRVLVWQLCFGFAQDLKLSWSQNPSPLVVTQCYLLRHWSRLNLPADSTCFCIFRHAEADTQDAEQKQGQRFHFSVRSQLSAYGL